MADVTLAIEGMSCDHCVKRVTKVLGGVAGVTVKSVVVGQAVVDTHDSADATAEAVAAIEKAGYPVKAVQ